MSGHSSTEEPERLIPMGVVLMTVGGILLLTVLAIWMAAPRYMPRPLYNAVAPRLAASGILPTRMPLAAAPERRDNDDGETAVLLPQSPAEEESEYPDYFVSAAEARVSDPGAGQPMQIKIPAIDVDAPVVEVSLQPITTTNGTRYYQWEVPAGYLAGWHDNSARLGQPGNTVINGHHNIYGEIFRDLVDLDVGDRLILYDQDKRYVYQVAETEIFPERGQSLSARRENAQWMAASDDERVTLITCWPYTDNSHRVVVVAKPVY
jgi:sortase A